MSAFDKLAQMTFAGVSFPVEEVTIKGGLRDHVHEYPHSPGGAPEKLGRKLYEISMLGNFQATFVKYPDLWPTKIGELVELFEIQFTGDLVVPTVGTIKAYCTNWTRKMTARIRSGEKMDLSFREDQSSAFLTDKLLSVDTTGMGKASEDFAVQAQAFTETPPEEFGITIVQRSEAISIFDAIRAIGDFATGLRDQVDLTSQLLESKILGLQSLCQQADRLTATQSPATTKLIASIHALWDSGERLRQDILQRGPSMVTYNVPTTMSVSAISAILYKGDASRGGEILGLNRISDAYAVPAGTKLLVYQGT